LTVTPGPSRAATMGAINADWLFDSAQTVVLGSVLSINETGREPLPDPHGGEAIVQSVAFTVQRCYKPATPCASGINFSERWTMMRPPAQITIGHGAIIFLQESNSSLTLPDFRFAWSVPWISVALDEKAAVGLSGKELLQADLSTGLNSSDPEARLDAMHYLGSFQRQWPGVATALWPVAQSDSTPLVERLSALSTLMGTPRPEYVALIEKLAETESGEIAQHPREAYNVGVAFMHVKDQRSLPDLIAIAQGPVETWHFGAVHAMRNLHNPKSIPTLVKALDDPDRSTQYQALITLAEITHKGGDYGPGLGLFDPDPGKYIDLWKRWWESEGRAEYGNGER